MIKEILQTQLPYKNVPSSVMELQPCLLTAQMILENRAVTVDFANANVSLRRGRGVHLEWLMTIKNVSRSMTKAIGSSDTNQKPTSERMVRIRVKYDGKLFNSPLYNL